MTAPRDEITKSLPLAALTALRSPLARQSEEIRACRGAPGMGGSTPSRPAERLTRIDARPDPVEG